jgi:hypothetical protein
MSELSFNPLNHPVCLEFPLWLEETAWSGHIPFAMYLVSVLRPRVFIELGAYRGVSYCAFCQAVKSLKLDTKCYAVDTWEGDEHAGKLDESVLAKLKAHHDPLYAEFSRLIRSTFDDALEHFGDGSVDLLHIDGFHTYDAVRHDFETWKPKLSERGVVIFHDINVRERGFGVWQFWDEIKREYPHFEFAHMHGLGVLAVGREIPAEFQSVLNADASEAQLIREFFAQYGARIEAVEELSRQKVYMSYLESCERVIKKSKFLRFYRVFFNEGVGGVFKRL